MGSETPLANLPVSASVQTQPPPPLLRKTDPSALIVQLDEL